MSIYLKKKLVEFVKFNFHFRLFFVYLICAATDGQALPPDVAPDQSFQPQVPAGLGIELVSFREYNVCCLSESISTIWARHWDHQQ